MMMCTRTRRNVAEQEEDERRVQIGTHATDDKRRTTVTNHDPCRVLVYIVLSKPDSLYWPVIPLTAVRERSMFQRTKLDRRNSL